MIIKFHFSLYQKVPVIYRNIVNTDFKNGVIMFVSDKVRCSLKVTRNQMDEVKYALSLKMYLLT